MAASMICRRTLQTFAKFPWKKPIKRHYATGTYFVLIPEVPPDSRESNPIMRHDELPKFTELYINNIVTGCAKLSLEFDSKFDIHLEELKDLSREKTFDQVFNGVEAILSPLHYAERTVNVLLAGDVNKYPESLGYRVQSQLNRSKSDRFLSVSFHNMLKELNANRGNLTEAQHRLLDMYLLECRLMSMDLTGKPLNILRSATVQLLKKHKEFIDRSVYQKSQYNHELTLEDADIVNHLPRHVRMAMAADKTQPYKGPWRVRLLGYVYDSFMEMCPRRDLRWTVWQANNLICTHKTTDVRFTTFETVEEIRENRRDIAKSLGYANYAQISMETKMAGNVETVMTMLDTYKTHFLPMAKIEIGELQSFASSRGMFADLRQWDIPYYRRLHSESLFKVNNIDRSPYFTHTTVLNTMFRFCEKLFEIKIEEKPSSETNTWHPDVSVYDVYNIDGTYVSTFYIDPFARPESKLRLNSAEFGRGRSELMSMTPITYILLSLNKSTIPGVPSLMSYKEVLTLFHQFGIGLQQMLTTVPYYELSGQRNIEWDALHVCGYLMQQFAQLPTVIKDMSAHYQSGEQLTDTAVDNLIKNQKHMAAYDMCHELYYSAFDIECHLENETYFKDIQREMYKTFMPIPMHIDDWSWCSDPTLWVGNTHAAAYYSYTWSKMLTANIFESFQEADLNNEKQLVKVGKRFRDTYLSLGGAVDAMTVFRRFKGCNPSLDSLTKMYPKC